ncbi:O-antigen polymerase [Terrilactibacillus laevilacticus]|uniref:O-antigen polymerase n=1 Tax=Terrilactibacillus laevilacticus TaxID=1380157 RepID=UPI00114724E0|nr:O-antigen polymerase [Terrilactibacillus laevilacticus]
MHNRKKSLLLISLLFFFLSCIIFISLINTMSTDSLVLIIIFETVILIPFLLYVLHIHHDPLDICLVAFLYMGLGFLGRYIILKLFPYLSPLTNEDIITEGLIVQTLSMLSMLIGYYIYLKISYNRVIRLDQVKKIKISGLVMVLYTIVLISRIYLIVTNNAIAFAFNDYTVPTGFLLYATNFSLMGPVCWGFLYYYYLTEKRKKNRKIVFAILLFEIFWGILIGAKTPLVNILIMWLLAKSISGGINITKRQLFMIFPIIILTFILINSIRGIYGSEFNDSKSSLRDQISTVKSLNISSDEITNSLVQMAQRSDVLDSVSRIVSLTPSIYPYQYGKQYLYMPLIPMIPRTLWSDKPSYDDGLYNAWTYRGMSKNQFVHYATGITGGFYWNFGLIGTLICMFFTGVIYSFLYVWFHIKGKLSDYGFILYSLIFLEIINMEGTFYTMYVELMPKIILVISIVLALKIIKGNNFIFSKKEEVTIKNSKGTVYE